MIAGFILTRYSELVLRGLGPSLNVNDVPVSGRLPDPILELYDSAGTLLGSNDNWRENPASSVARLSSLGLDPAHDLEAALIGFSGPGAYTAVLRGQDGSTGIGLIEAYVIGLGEAANLSTRALVETGDNVMIGGFIIEQTNGNTRTVVRAIGPSLANSNIGNPLADPMLELYNSQGTTIASNDDWADAQGNDLSLVGLAPQNERESAILMRLDSGAYTAIVRAKNDSTGVALVEVYNLH